MNKIKYVSASALLCLVLFMSAFADGDTGIGSRSENPSASGSYMTTTNIIQTVINNLLYILG